MKGCKFLNIITIFRTIEKRVYEKIRSFDKIRKSRDKNKFIEEFVFCLLTPQSKAREAHKAVGGIMENNYHINGTVENIKGHLKSVRFYNNKASYIIKNRKYFLSDDFMDRVFDDSQCSRVIRDFLVKNITGYGYKEASHFLRNIGRGHNIAILDRHILKGLCELGCINEIPSTMNRKKYLDIEENLVKLSKDTGIDVLYLDFVLWYARTNDIFK